MYMANKNQRNAGNAPGRWYVDDSCTDCDLCREVAAAIFGRNNELGVSVVIHQPANEQELASAEEARHSCPTDSIGSDGLEE